MCIDIVYDRPVYGKSIRIDTVIATWTRNELTFIIKIVVVIS